MTGSVLPISYESKMRGDLRTAMIVPGIVTQPNAVQIWKGWQNLVSINLVLGIFYIYQSQTVDDGDDPEVNGIAVE